MDCIVFKNRLNDYLHDNLSGDMESMMKSHMKECEPCKRLYDEETAIDDTFKSAFSIDDRDIKSSRELIMNAIDKNRYGKSPFKKVYFGFRKRAFAYAACAALLLLVIVKGPYLSNLFGSYNNAGLPMPGQSTAGKFPDRVVSEALPLPKIIPSVVLWQAYTKLPKGLSWSIIYGGNNKLMIFSSKLLLLYSLNLSDNTGTMKALELDELGYDYESGEVITMFEPSPDGNSAAIWNSDMNGGGSVAGVNSSLCLYNNFDTFKRKIFKRATDSKLACAWSPSSRYFGFVDINGGSITLYDSVDDKTTDIPFNVGNIKSIFISDFGDITIAADKNYELPKGTGYHIDELGINDILGYNKDGRIVYYYNGKIYERAGGAARIIADMGSSFSLVKKYKVTGVFETSPAIFTDGKSTKVYTPDSGLTSFSFSYDPTDRPMFSPDFKLCLLTDNNKDGIESYSVITQEGNSIKLPQEGNSIMSNYVWLDNTSLVRIRHGVHAQSIGDFSIDRMVLK
jgi:hypothetical protein